MRTYSEYFEILSLYEKGTAKKTIATTLGIPRGTVLDCIKRYGSVEALEKADAVQKSSGLFAVLATLSEPTRSTLHENYAYLLAMYLGDGYICRARNVYKIRIALDVRYPKLIDECAAAMQAVFEENKVNIFYSKQGNFVEVYCHHKHLPILFPQHAIGTKHTREIKLETWQQRIVEAYPLQFWKGLYHTDGSRFSNIVKGKDYPRYQFTNASEGIIQLFCSTCDRLGIEWTSKNRPSQKATHQLIHDIYISKRKDVEYLDQHVGPKC
ncbi:MAG: transcriptional regulator [Anaerolineae bacterium]